MKKGNKILALLFHTGNLRSVHCLTYCSCFCISSAMLAALYKKNHPSKSNCIISLKIAKMMKCEIGINAIFFITFAEKKLLYDLILPFRF